MIFKWKYIAYISFFKISTRYWEYLFSVQGKTLHMNNNSHKKKKKIHFHIRLYKIFHQICIYILLGDINTSKDNVKFLI